MNSSANRHLKWIKLLILNSHRVVSPERLHFQNAFDIENVSSLARNDTLHGMYLKDQRRHLVQYNLEMKSSPQPKVDLWVDLFPLNSCCHGWAYAVKCYHEFICTNSAHKSIMFWAFLVNWCLLAIWLPDGIGSVTKVLLRWEIWILATNGASILIIVWSGHRYVLLICGPTRVPESLKAALTYEDPRS